MYINFTILGQIITFVFLILFVMNYLWPNFIKIIEKREKKIKNGLLFYKKSKLILYKAEKQAKKIIFDANQKSYNILKLTNKNALNIINKSKLIAEQKKKNILLSAKQDIENICLKQKNKIYNAIKNNAFLIVKKILSDKKTINKKNINKFIKEIYIK